MRLHREASLSLFVGAATGALVLGIAGRMATAALAVAAGHPHNLSLRGLLEVVFLGALLGAPGGLLLLVLRRRGRTARLTRGMMVGAALFACSVLVSWSAERMESALAPSLLLTCGVAAIVCLAYGVGADTLLIRLLDRPAAKG